MTLSFFKYSILDSVTVTMATLADSIISIFLEKHQCVLTDTEVVAALVKQGILCNVNDIHHNVKLLSPGLFQPINYQNQPIKICVEPKVTCFSLPSNL